MVETGRIQAMGQMDSTCAAPPRALGELELRQRPLAAEVLGVAVQVKNLKKQILKPVFFTL